MENSTQQPTPPFKEKKQSSPGLESEMDNKPKWQAVDYNPANKLKGKCALITGGDSGIGRAVAIMFAREGANVAITYLPAEVEDAKKTQAEVEKVGSMCVLLEGDLTSEAFCKEAVENAVNKLGALDVLVSNAAHQMRKKNIEDITSEEWDRTFKTNIYAYFYLAKAAVAHMRSGSAIIVTSSETAMEAPKDLMDYASTKGAINTFTQSLAKSLASRGIRVNAVAPGPVWTPLNPSDEGAEKETIKNFGKSHPMSRPAQPEELAPAYVFLASNADSSYVTGAIIPVTGGVPLY
jgi:NAD(P)-dependent dehydrogenase (short-subunit alcohol dehydrogenase family)